MKRQKPNIEEILGAFTSPPEQKVAGAEERALRRLQSETEGGERPPVPETTTAGPRKWRGGAIGAVAAGPWIAEMQITVIRRFISGIDAHAIVETTDGGLYGTSD